jgi:hypothetical protein
LFFGRDALMPSGKTADIVHWSHSGYHVRGALGAASNDPRAIEAGLHAAVDKMWAALDKMGLTVSIQETRDNSDGIQSQIGPVSRKYCRRLDDVPERTAARTEQLGGYVATVNFSSPLKFPGLGDAGWERLKQRAQWDRLNVFEARALRLLNFIAFDFSDPAKAALETLAENGRLTAYVDEYKSIVATNGGHIVVKCAFQMISKSQQVARKLDDIAVQLTEKCTTFLWRWPRRCEDHDMECTSRATRKSSICTRQTQRGVEGSLQRYANHVLLRQLHLIDRARLAHLMPCVVLVGAVGVILKGEKDEALTYWPHHDCLFCRVSILRTRAG